ncbi:hypothetical protein N7467_001939 [Penicillium canescens]|nr:hypothetical protein N7467_001939 [Penicillium canescens]
MPPIRGKRGPELDCLTRAKICELHATNGWEAKRYKQQSLPRSGTPRKLNGEDRDHIYDTIQQNPSILKEDLLAEVDYKNAPRFGILPTKWVFENGGKCSVRYSRLYTLRNVYIGPYGISILRQQIGPASIGLTNVQLNVE